jgi:hypothetical protein
VNIPAERIRTQTSEPDTPDQVRINSPLQCNGNCLLVQLKSVMLAISPKPRDRSSTQIAKTDRKIGERMLDFLLELTMSVLLISICAINSKSEIGS